MNTLIRLLNTLLAALLTGIIFGIWIGTNPQILSAYAYVEQQQSAITALNVLMPAAGGFTILLTIINAIKHRKDSSAVIPLLIAAALFTVTGLVTRLGNQPINAIVMTWNKNNVPANWIELRDKWWMLHKIRTAASMVALTLVIWTNTRKDKD